MSVLDGGVAAWSGAGYELFGDVNAPSKAFGELVASRLSVPFISADRLHRLVMGGGDVAVVDVRRYEEYSTMNIPTGRNAPGVEVVLRGPQAVPKPETLLVLNCAGRTRSIIATQSLRNVGIANPVASLENGTIGWKLAGLELGTGASARLPSPLNRSSDIAAAARGLADRAGVRRTSLALMDARTRYSASTERTRYYFDIRDRDDYLAGHAPGSRWAPGGQLVQETDFYAPVRGAEIALADDDGTRANVTGSWLAQMGWDVAVVDDAMLGELETGPWRPRAARARRPRASRWALAPACSPMARPRLSRWALGRLPGGPPAGKRMVPPRRPGPSPRRVARQGGRQPGTGQRRRSGRRVGTGHIAGRLGGPHGRARRRQGGVGRSRPAL